MDLTAKERELLLNAYLSGSEIIRVRLAEFASGYLQIGGKRYSESPEREMALEALRGLVSKGLVGQVSTDVFDLTESGESSATKLQPAAYPVGGNYNG